ncbi:MAG: 3-ketoacyl-CoA thiolase [Parachlamydiales bacterium]|jgi:acetyl-CoA C-acetyltransferase/acetyl-CoA acyltransferase
MRPLRKRVFAAAGYTTIFMGSGRPEFKPGTTVPMEVYLLEAAQGSLSQLQSGTEIDEGVIGSFMSGRFLNQANLPGFLPFVVPSLLNKPCVGVEGACGTGGKAILTGVKTILAETSDLTFVTAFEIQNTMKALYGADVLAGAGHYSRQRKNGHAYFFPGLFSDRAGAYLEKYDAEKARNAMAKWYELSILNARRSPKAQEYHNASQDLFSLGMTPPDPSRFVPHLNFYDCSKVSDGAASLIISSEEGLTKAGLSIKDAVEIIGFGEAEGDITQDPEDLTTLATTAAACKAALKQANLSISDISLLELHDCFSITALLALEAIGLAKPGEAPDLILSNATSAQGIIPTNLSGGLIGFGHPTGATGVRQLVDLLHQFTVRSPNQVKPKSPYGMLISMGGNDKTVSCIIVKHNG